MVLPIPISNNVLYAWQYSDIFGRAIVAGLLLMSIWAWIIMCDKCFALMKIRRESKRFMDSFEVISSPMELALRADSFDGPLADVYRAGVDEVMDVLRVRPELVETYCRRRTLPRALTVHEVDRVRTTLERVVTAQILVLEERLSLLNTIIAVSPFLGLLGTVWGVMLAFIGMAQRGRPEISAIAPGVSGALLTTVAGLIVAIPAVWGNNLIINAVQRTTVEMDNFVENFISLLKLQIEEPENAPASTDADA